MKDEACGIVYLLHFLEYIYVNTLSKYIYIYTYICVELYDSWRLHRILVSQNNNREVAAIKCIKKDSLNSRSIENMLTEIELLKTLKHENIVYLIDFEVMKLYIYYIFLIGKLIYIYIIIFSKYLLLFVYKIYLILYNTWSNHL